MNQIASGTLTISRPISSAAGVICLTLFSRAETMCEQMWKESVLQVSGDLYRSANLCNRTTVFSLNWRVRDTWMATEILTLILELIDFHQSRWARCIAFASSLKQLFSPSFFFKLGMRCWGSVFLSRQMRTEDFFSDLVAETIMLTW